MPDNVLGAGNIVMKKTDTASALIQFTPRWFGRSVDDGINSEGWELLGKHLGWAWKE